MDEHGPLAKTVLEYQDVMKNLVPAVKENEDWAPLESLVAVDEFERVGTRREVQNWREYTGLLTKWAGAIEKFETTVQRVSELPGMVYSVAEERHFRGQEVTVVNSLSVFEFDADEKIRRLSVYLQQAR